MYRRVEVGSNSKIDFILVSVTIMLRWWLAERAGNFWWLSEFENVANLDFGNLKHLQNPEHLLLIAPSIDVQAPMLDL